VNAADAFSGKDEDVAVIVFAGSVNSLSRCMFHGGVMERNGAAKSWS